MQRTSHELSYLLLSLNNKVTGTVRGRIDSLAEIDYSEGSRCRGHFTVEPDGESRKLRRSGSRMQCRRTEPRSILFTCPGVNAQGPSTRPSTRAGPGPRGLIKYSAPAYKPNAPT